MFGRRKRQETLRRMEAEDDQSLLNAAMGAYREVLGGAGADPGEIALQLDGLRAMHERSQLLSTEDAREWLDLTERKKEGTLNPLETQKLQAYDRFYSGQ